jgi:hypothetical protein
MAMTTNTIILHLNWLDLFERFVGSLISLSVPSGYKKDLPFIVANNGKTHINGLILLLDN